MSNEPGSQTAAQPGPQLPVDPGKLLQQLPAWIWTTDSALRFDGHAGAESLRMPTPLPEGSPLQAFFTSEPSYAREQHRRALQGEHVSFGFTRDGVSYEAQLRPLRDPEGKVRGVVGVALDASDGHAMQERQAITQRLEAMGRVAGAIAHDFNNILTIIVSYAQFLLERFEPPDEAHEDASVIHDAAKRAGRLIQKLLVFSRRQVVRMHDFDLADLTRGAENRLRDTAGDNVTLRLELDEAPLQVHADEGQLEQALVHLITNAREASDASAEVVVSMGRVRLRAPSPSMVLALDPGDYARITVSDTGEGMKPEVQAQAVDPFFSTKRKGKGSGLGLSAVYGIVRQAGGGLEITSEPGLGTRVSIYLPLAASQDTEAPRLLPADPAASTAERGR